MATRHPTATYWWAGAVLSLIAVDAVRDRRHDGSTLSESVRDGFAVEESELGATAFTVLWTTLYLWFWHHIMRKRYRRGSILRRLRGVEVPGTAIPGGLTWLR